MSALRIDLEFTSYWHAGTGRGAGKTVDALVQRSPAGLPILPGKTLKGLLRDTVTFAEWIGALQPLLAGGATSRTEGYFGSRLLGNPPQGMPGAEAPVLLEEARFRSTEASVHTPTARIGATRAEQQWWEGWAKANPTQVKHLFRTVSSTQIDEAGVALDRSLRSIEVSVPLTLTAVLVGPRVGAWKEDLRAAMPFLREACSHRTRGLGRVMLTAPEEAAL